MARADPAGEDLSLPVEFSELTVPDRIAAIKARIRTVESDCYDHLLARREADAAGPLLRPEEYTRLVEDRDREIRMCQLRRAALIETLSDLSE